MILQVRRQLTCRFADETPEAIHQLTWITHQAPALIWHPSTCSLWTHPITVPVAPVDLSHLEDFPRATAGKGAL
jgi:hypothetical protein